MLITPREILRSLGMCKVISGAAWRPVSHMCVRVSDLWRGMASPKSLTSVSELKNWMLRQPDQKIRVA